MTAGKGDQKASVGAASWLFHVVTSVGIIVVNKSLMATHGFSFGSMQESVSKKQEKAAAAAINSSPPLTSQKLPYHSSSTFSRENCLVLLGMTHKLQEKTLRVQGTLLELLTTRESSYKTSKSLIESEETMPGSSRQLSRKGNKAAESDCRVSKEPICQVGNSNPSLISPTTCFLPKLVEWIRHGLSYIGIVCNI